MSISTQGERTEIKSMLVVHQGALGDFILALPVLKTLRDAFPQANSAIIGYPRILELVENRFYADEVHSIDQKGIASFFTLGGSLDPVLSQFFQKFDLIFIFGRDEKGPFIQNLKRICQGQILHIQSFPPWDSGVHVTDHLLRELSKYGYSAPDNRPKLYLKEEDRVWGEDYWREKGLDHDERSRVIILHPGSGSKKKVWPLERFAFLSDHLQKTLNSKILVVSGPAEGEEVRKTFENEEDHCVFMAKSLPLIRLASLMEGCRLFIGNDSGISHMAAALGIPTIAIFGPTDPRAWSPRGEKVWVVHKKSSCSPCPQERFFLCKDQECLKMIEAGEVLTGIEKMGVRI